ncbi:hypothetical protein HGM15179_019734 [Zosterops borbonicus]|uniref:CCHC-type domain-containing protein n=1 Tax=Zosterops borbonicus TaxID=364589 RepID=A0A8K1DA19_9PASS|nr:hypothetical protein HGM15179_019734 [Zosterops borbonicus]
MVRQGRRQARKVTWHPVPFSELKELNKAAKEHGRGSHYFRHILEATFAAHTLLPHDIRNIIGCLLTPAEYLLWERNWKKQLATLVTAYANDTNKPNVILEQIAGEGNYLRPTDQFDIPDSALREIASAAKASLTLVPDESVPSQSFTSIKQGVEESFTKFVDRLKATLEKQLESADARKEMLVKMAFLNANATTKPILLALPLDPSPTIDQMIEACIKHQSTENTVAQAVAQGIAQGVSGAFAVITAKDRQRCFNCGQFGHFIAECPEKEAVDDHRKNHQWINSNPNRWWKQGNGKQSAGRRRATTQNTPPTPTPKDQDADQFPHGPKTPASEVPPRMKKTTFTPRYRWEPGASW